MEKKILGNRYQLLEKIGGGGMAIVYKAKCTLLNRFVAVKILRPEFTNDDEFVKRFRVEAQSAASLSHPNIVSIYDVGDEDGIHYIVMEYVDGITLKDYIVQNGTIGWNDAVNIEIQICSAIEHAHRHNIIHRDIKPHNILLTHEGVAKVTDFGIARAVSSSTITMVGSTIGSVHYFSPEQARGGFIDEKSDLYSLGIALYEMVTGKVPFDGETPVAVALKHLQDEPLAPVELKSDLPKAVNNIIIKSIQKVPGHRYQSAKSLLVDLNKVLNDPDGDFVIFNETTSDESPTRRIKALNDIENNETGDAVLTGNESDEVKKRKKKKQQRIKKIVMIASIFIIVLCAVIVAWSNMSKKPEPIFLGNYVGKTIEEAMVELKKIGVTVTEQYVNNETKEKGIILEQDVEPGLPIKTGTSLDMTLKISSGPNVLVVPDLRNIEYRNAITEIENLRMKHPKLKYVREDEFDDIVTIEHVTRTFPEANTVIKPDEEITVYVSKGFFMPQTTVPDLKNKTQQEAKQALLENGLTLGQIIPEGNNFNSFVVEQSPQANTVVEQGTPVDIILSSVDDRSIEVTLPEEYKNMSSMDINVRIDVVPNDLGTVTTPLSVTVKKSEFPRIFTVPVPNGYKASVYFDNNWQFDMQF